MSNYSGAKKIYNETESSWWLRSANASINSFFLTSSTNGSWNNNSANTLNGISPAFKIS